MRFVVSLLAGVLLLLQHTPVHAERGVIDNADGFADLRAKPSGESAVVARVKAGEVFEFSAEDTEGELLGYEPGWYKATLGDGKTGWMYHSSIRLYFERSELKDGGPGDEVNSDKRKGFAYYPTARLAAKGDLKALRTFFHYRGDGAAGEEHDFMAIIVIHLAGDGPMAEFISRQTAARREDLCTFILSLIWSREPKEYLRLHFPKTTAALGLQRPRLDPLPCGARVIAGHGSGKADGSAGQAQFMFPMGIAADGAGNIYVADANGETLRRIKPDGSVETVAGAYGTREPVDGVGKDARFSSPGAVAVGSDGNIYLADDRTKLRKVTPQGVVTTVAKGLNPRDDRCGLAVDRDGVVYLPDPQACVIRKIERDGTVALFAGKAGEEETVNGPVKDARFDSPGGIAAAPDGSLYVIEPHVIRKIDARGMVTTLAGKPDASAGNDGAGKAASFSNLSAIAIDGQGVLYVADDGAIRQVSPAGVVRTLQTAKKERLPLPRYLCALTVDPQGRVLVVDGYTAVVIRIELAH